MSERDAQLGPPFASGGSDRPVAASTGPPVRRTRRQFLGMVGAGLLTLAAPRTVAAARLGGTARGRFASRPDLNPPAIDVTAARGDAAPGYVFVAPASGSSQLGPLIVDERGEPIWFLPLTGKLAHDLRVQTLYGEPVLTWWEGQYAHGFGEGEYVVVDSSYEEVTRISAANGYAGDLHECTLTPDASALISVYNRIPADLSRYGGPVDGTLVESVVQEIDVATGMLLFEWHSADHVPIDESYLPSTAGIWDYFHLNSIDLLADGNLLVSARHTSTVYKLDRGSGEILWRLGGKQSDFRMGDGARFAYQHDARGHAGDLVSIFDDGAYSQASAIEPTSRAIVLGLDTEAMTAELARAQPDPSGALSFAMGNVELLPDGGMFVGWGTVPSFSEFSSSGELRFDASFRDGAVSYRAYRDVWTGAPRGKPSIATARTARGGVDVFVSWNGATEIARWQLLAADAGSALRPVHTVASTGFETRINLPRLPAGLAAVALDVAGGELGRTLAHRP